MTSTRVRRIAAASRPAVAQVAQEAFGNAVDAVVAGVFAAAALVPSVLLGPVQIIIGGAGSGLRAIDGRVRQPGMGVPRPRGFLPDASIPDSARVGVPLLPAALVAAALTAGGGSLDRVTRPAVGLARELSEPRAKLLERLARRGAATLLDIRADLLAVAGRNVHGLLTEADLDRAVPDVLPCTSVPVDGRRIATVPWGARAVYDDAAEPVPARSGEVVAAVDGRGMVAIAYYEAPSEGLTVPELGLVAPFCADPVMRGQPRTRPGVPLPVAAPIMVTEQEGFVDLAIGVAGSGPTEAALRDIARALVADRVEDALAQGQRLTSEPVAVIRTREGVRAITLRAQTGEGWG